VGAHGQLTQSAILHNPRTKYKCSKNVFSVTTIALSCAHICARLLQFLMQSLIGSPGEGTGTRPDYLVNRDDQKMRGHSGKKIARKSRNSSRLNSRSSGCTGTVDSGPKCAHSWNQLQTLKYFFCCHISARLNQCVLLCFIIKVAKGIVQPKFINDGRSFAECYVGLF